ncbi:unnamed protein product [Cladocopium goreaui]|uniref:Cys-loop ligand-gated ion channel n=1 Tax=Cladocopium goreaui TaxID=2562237 RepID=A0A9P1G9R7_9DINO|nr:unnamed protein product [Cladocopium goreaui]
MHELQGYNHDVNHDETKMHELHQTYGTLLSEEQNLKIRVTIHQILAVDLDQETFTMELDVCFRWKDPRLRNAKTRVWLPRESTLKGRRTCEGGTCYCRGGLRGQRCSKLPFVLGIFKEEKGKDYIKVEDKNGGYHDWQLLSSFIYKEEPNFSDLGQLFRGDRGGSSIVIFSKLMEEPTVLNDFQRLSNGETGETVFFRKLRADFKENMELEHFPFDRQLLQFTITASMPASMLKLEVDEKVNSVCRVKDLPEYKVDKEQNEAVGILKEKTTAANVNNKQYSQVKVMVHLQRKPQKYMVNIVFMVYMLVFASCSSFVIPLEKTGPFRDAGWTFGWPEEQTDGSGYGFSWKQMRSFSIKTCQNTCEVKGVVIWEEYPVYHLDVGVMMFYDVLCLDAGIDFPSRSFLSSRSFFPNSVSLGSSAIVKVPEQVGAAKSAENRVPKKVPRKSFLFQENPSEPDRHGARLGTGFPGRGSQARLLGKVTRNRLPSKGSQQEVPKQGSQEQVPKQGSQARAPSKRFPSKVPRNRFPSKVPRQGYQGFPMLSGRFPGKVPKGFQARFPGTGPKQGFPHKGSKARVPRNTFPSKVPKQGFPARGSQARFSSKVPRTRFPGTDSQARVPSKRFPSKVPRLPCKFLPRQGSQARFPGTGSQARFAGRGS